MEEEQEKNNVVGSKLRTTFAVFVMFVLLAAVAVVFLGIEIPTQQQQSSQEKQQQESDIESSIPKLTGLVEELENQGSSFLDKTTSANESQKEEGDLVCSHFSELNCKQLSDIASSFEDGWGKALSEFSARCESGNETEIEQQVKSLVK